MRLGSTVSLSLAVVVAGGCATGGPQRIVTDDRGMTVYIFERDVPGTGRSACRGECAEDWPPVPASRADGEQFGSFIRADGVSQLTHEGRPLYYHAADNEPGDRKGDGVGGLWHVVPRQGGADIPDTGDLY